MREHQQLPHGIFALHYRCYGPQVWNMPASLAAVPLLIEKIRGAQGMCRRDMQRPAHLLSILHETRTTSFNTQVFNKKQCDNLPQVQLSTTWIITNFYVFSNNRFVGRILAIDICNNKSLQFINKHVKIVLKREQHCYTDILSAVYCLFF